MVSRPATDVSVVVLDSIDSMVAQLFSRLKGVTQAEYLWEPVDDMWSVRKRDDGSVSVDGAGDRDVEPAPVTTIAWRMWHLSVDCFADYTRRVLGDGRDVEPDATWYLDADEAASALSDSWGKYRAAISSRDRWWDELGPDWGPWAHHSMVDMALHCGNELVHHGAEIALLRDLYRLQADG
ncbi:MAG: DinB family protein [Acidobacteria bacterium]|nr:DinB family protein [Acidobacteriota bacterium]